MKYKELYIYGVNRLKDTNPDEASIDARLLLEFATGKPYGTLFSDPAYEVPKEDMVKYEEYVNKRLLHIPLQHITKTQCFMGFDFTVSKDVLIPRPDTEILVEEVLKRVHDGMKILDVCTGSGCILISLLKLSNDTTGIGTDISDKALDIARLNSDKLGLSDFVLDGRLSWVQGDLFENIEGTFDIIVSNPPYIATGDIETLMPEVKDNDPFIALDGHEDGLFFYKRIINEAGDYLTRGGLLAFEIGNTQASSVSKLMEEAGYIDVTVYKDLAANDRVVLGVKSVR